MASSFSTTSLRLLAPVLWILVLALKGLLFSLSPGALPLHLGLALPPAVLGLQDGSLARDGVLNVPTAEASPKNLFSFFSSNPSDPPTRPYLLGMALGVILNRSRE